MGKLPQWRQPEGAAGPRATSTSTGSSATCISTTCPRRISSSWCARRRRRALPIELIATRRPYDDPGVERVYYRFRRVTETALTKTHMPYALNPARMARFKAWFFDAPYEVKALPSYAPEVASNPFVAFEQLPVEFALPLHAGRGAVHPDGLHQGAGVPRSGGAERDRRPHLGAVRRARRPPAKTAPISPGSGTTCACRPSRRATQGC